MAAGEDPDGEGADPVAFLTGGDELDAVREAVVSFLKDAVTEAGAQGVVVGLSGGVDSTLTATLAVDALGADRVLGLGLPTRASGDHALEARTVAEGLGIEFRECDLRPLVDLFEDHVAPEVAPTGGKRAVGNVIARLRMVALYYAANARSLLVLGTANRSERLLGYFTKYGDGAADLFPLGDLYKTEVRALASRVDVPDRIVTKEPTADLWRGQTDAGDIGAGYDTVDPVLRRVVDRGDRVERVVAETGLAPETVETVAEMYRDSRHKRALAPTPGVGGRGERDGSRPGDPAG